MNVESLLWYVQLSFPPLGTYKVAIGSIRRVISLLRSVERMEKGISPWQHAGCLLISLAQQGKRCYDEGFGGKTFFFLYKWYSSVNPCKVACIPTAQGGKVSFTFHLTRKGSPPLASDYPVAQLFSLLRILALPYF